MQWTDTVNTLYEQNVPTPLSDEAIASLINDIVNERLEIKQTQSDGFMDIPDETLPFQ